MVILADFPMSDEEKEYYKNYALETYKGKKIMCIEITAVPDTEFVDIRYTFEKQKFDRIRRITGYLVGTVDRWNDGKISELNDRQKHEVSK